MTRKPTDADWSAIQAAVNQDCPLSIVMQLVDGRATADEAMDRIVAYAEAAFAQAAPAAPVQQLCQGCGEVECDPQGCLGGAGLFGPPTAAPAQPVPTCRTDGRCQYAIDHGAEGLGHCPVGKCCMPAQPVPEGAAQMSDAEILSLWMDCHHAQNVSTALKFARALLAQGEKA